MSGDDDDNVDVVLRSTCPRLRSPGWSLAGATELARAAASARSRSPLEEKEYLDLRRQDRDGGAEQRRSLPRPPSALADDHGRLVRESRRRAGGRQ